MFKLMSSFRRTIALLAAAGTLAVWAVPCRADDKSFKIVVAAILASEKSDYVDPRLKCLPDTVKVTEPQLKGFRVAGHTHRTLAFDQSWAFPLVDDQVVRISVEKAPKDEKSPQDKEKAAKDRERVALRIKPPQMGEIFYVQSTCGKFFPVITPYLTKDKERLIIAIGIKCKEKD
jgi:hypothetical protein